MQSAPGENGRGAHVLDTIDVRSVAGVALRFYSCVLLAVFLGIGAVWFAASALGLVAGFEHFMRSVGFTHFHLLSGQLLLGAGMIAAVVVTTLVALTVLAAALYNQLAQRWGGVRVSLTPVAMAVPAPTEAATPAVDDRRPAPNVSSRRPPRVVLRPPGTPAHASASAPSNGSRSHGRGSNGSRSNGRGSHGRGSNGSRSKGSAAA